MHSTNRFLILCLFSVLTLVQCKEAPLNGEKDIAGLEALYREKPTDSLYQQLMQAVGKEIRQSSDKKVRDTLLRKAIELTKDPEKGNLREVFLLESLKNNPGGPNAANDLWAVAETAAIRNRMEEASLLFLGFKDRYPGDARNREGEKYILASQRNRVGYLRYIDHHLASTGGKAPDSSAVHAYVALCEAHAIAFPGKAESPEYLFKAASLANATSDPAKAVQLYNWISTYYPGHPKAKESLMMKGFLLESVLGQPALAKEAYSLFIKRYPTDSLADDATYLLKNLEK
jgi:TolA-binding protein